MAEILSLTACWQAQYRARPDATALRSDSGSVTFYELERLVAQLVRAGQTVGVSCQHIVAVYLPPSEVLIAALLAIDRLRGIYLPLDVGHPINRTHSILEQSQADLVITASAHSAALFGLDIPILCWDTPPSRRLLSPTAPTQDPALAHTQYLLYTSGSTGTPKGVLGTWTGLYNRLNWMWRRFPWQRGECQLFKSSPGFIDSLWEMLGGLLRGVPTLILSDRSDLSPHRLIWALAHYQVTRATLIPSHLQTLVEADPKLGERLPLMQLWTVSGEALTANLVKAFQERVPQGRLLNLYGSSEVAADVLYWLAPLGFSAAEVPLGSAIDNVAVMLFDEAGQRAEEGEIWVAGEAVALGYHRTPSLTQERFAPPAALATDRRRWFRTGDWGRYNTEGDILFRGRRDHQIKLRGMRTELGEVEVAIEALPLIRRAVVLPRYLDEKAKAQGRVDHLIAFITTAAGARGEPFIAALKASLQARLPDHAIPASWRVVDRFPLNANGKLDRQQLTQWAHRGAPDNTHGKTSELPQVAPRNQQELFLFNVWRELLPISPHSPFDNFFTLGGDSLLAMRLVARIASRYGSEISLAQLLKHPTVETLSQLIQRGRGNERPGQRRYLVEIKPNADQEKPICLFFPGIGGRALYSYPLACALQSEFSFYGVEYPGVDGECTPRRRMLELVNDLLPELLQCRPGAPLYLVGHSFGSLVAYAVAQQAIASGRSVRYLLAVDPDMPGQTIPDTACLASPTWWKMVAAVLGEVFVRPIYLSTELLAKSDIEGCRRLFIASVIKAGLFPDDTPAAHINALIEVWLACLELRNYYYPLRSPPVPVVLMLTQGDRHHPQKAAQQQKINAFWNNLTVEEVISLPGTHQNILHPPYVHGVADYLLRFQQG